ncbi:MAG TPA: 1,4-alpha-glucan branching protein domain-containing protein [Isosphaeraceae bacterium]|nr:1,4-alpha-glucan branching protein domain-containing protein [Isosphaeraceae bacterium]
MPKGYLALVIELHHPLPGPGREVGHGWAAGAVETYWPLLKALVGAADAGLAEVVTLAVSPSWTAIAADPAAQALVRLELGRRIDQAGRDTEAHPWSEHWAELRQFVVDRWDSDPLGPLRRVHESGAVEVIPTTSSHAWLPAVADVGVVARAQVTLAAADLAGLLRARPQGIWLPHRAYLPELERTMASAGLRYFGVDADAFRRGTVRPPADIFGPLVTVPGTAAFGVDPEPTSLLADPDRRYGRDTRYAVPWLAQAAVADHATHFLDTWRHRAAQAWGPFRHPPICVAAVSAHDLGGSWVAGGQWLEHVLRRLAEPDGWVATTPGRYLDRYPDGPIGRPGPSAGGLMSVRPNGSDLLDRCRSAAETLADLVGRGDHEDALTRRVLAQMTRLLLIAQSLDWHLPPGLGIGPEAGLDRARRCLNQFAELAGLAAAARIDPARLAEVETGPAYLPGIDIGLLAEGF